MRYHVRHTTRFAYSQPVSVCHNLLCLTPRVSPTLTSHRPTLTISPQPTTRAQRTDSFGNIIDIFSVEHEHEHLSIEAWADVEVQPNDLPALTPTPAWDRVAEDLARQRDPGWLDTMPFLYDSPRVRRDRAAAEYAESSFTPGRPILDAARDLTARIHRDFTYQPGSTHVDTMSDEALADRKGVCQDFAHVQLAALRSLGLPARYVSGYLRTIPPEGRPALIGADQSHAWVSVYTGPELGWVDLDPTNDVIVDTDHITLAWGRDYTDVAPIRGVFLGGEQSNMSVEVQVKPVG